MNKMSGMSKSGTCLTACPKVLENPDNQRSDMDKTAIEQRIREHLPDATVTVEGGDGKYTAEVISAQFDGCGTVKRHRMVYASLQAEIQSGALHALSIKAKTPEEAQG